MLLASAANASDLLYGKENARDTADGKVIEIYLDFNTVAKGSSLYIPKGYKTVNVHINKYTDSSLSNLKKMNGFKS